MSKVFQWHVCFRHEGRSRVRAIVSGADGKTASRLIGMDECRPRENAIVNSKDYHPYKDELFHLFAEVPGEEADMPDRGGDRISIEMDGVTEVVTSIDKWRARHGGWNYVIPKPAPLDVVNVSRDRYTYYDLNGKTVIVGLAG